MLHDISIYWLIKKISIKFGGGALVSLTVFSSENPNINNMYSFLMYFS